jgi:Na+/H+ antiporter NhaD/arsenite permease-like protein
MILFAATFTPPGWLALPFCLLLLSLACCPLMAPRFWEHHYKKVVSCFGLMPVMYYFIKFQSYEEYLGVAMDYASFMILIGSLYVVSSGIFLSVKGESTPAINTLFLLVAGLIANVCGTTGASMLLIRPWIRMNKYRITGLHVAFFIFVVSNIGGALTPVGDPPLFMGYLKGVPFGWGLAHYWKGWAVTISCVLAIFYVMDRMNFMRAPKLVREAQTAHEEWRFDGAHNVGLMGLVLAAVIICPGGIRELVMVAVAALSYSTTNQNIHAHNHFTFAPIKEVGWIFFGIFGAMKPVLDYMVLHAGDLGIRSHAQFYWCSGLLSGVLDNTPTYLTFLAAAFGLHHMDMENAHHMQVFLTQQEPYLVAISLGSVCFGALTYIGNGPNLMVKSICDHAKVHTPHFFNYVYKYSVPVLVPVFGLITWLFFHT